MQKTGGAPGCGVSHRVDLESSDGDFFDSQREHLRQERIVRIAGADARQIAARNEQREEFCGAPGRFAQLVGQA